MCSHLSILFRNTKQPQIKQMGHDLQEVTGSLHPGSPLHQPMEQGQSQPWGGKAPVWVQTAHMVPACIRPQRLCVIQGRIWITSCRQVRVVQKWQWSASPTASAWLCLSLKGCDADVTGAQPGGAPAFFPFSCRSRQGSSYGGATQFICCSFPGAASLPWYSQIRQIFVVKRKIRISKRTAGKTHSALLLRCLLY